MRAIDRKLLRDLRQMWAQATAIALVMAAGVAVLIVAVGAHRSLYDTRETYYDRYRFADIFASTTRAPIGILDEIRAIAGIAAVEPRVVGAALIDVEGSVRPATGQVISLPARGEVGLNALLMEVGRTPDPTRVDEVVVSAAFATAHELGPGASLSALINGSRRDLKITGIAHSPEFIYTISPGDLVPDDKRFAVLWMSEIAAAAAFDMNGAFNDLVVRVLHGARTDDVIDRLDAALRRYGGRGAYARKDQISHAFIEAELEQLAAMARVMPPIFLAVAAFLINMTLARIIAMEREQIGLLKAIGYRRSAIAWHYLKFALVISLAGLVVGALAGTWLGRALTQLYATLFHFPFLYFSRSPELYFIAGMIALLAGTVGAMRSVWTAVRLAPAVAMAPPAPPRFGRGMIERARIIPHLSQLSMMVVRHLLRWPLKAISTSIGVAMSAGLIVGSLFALDSVEVMIDFTFFQTDRQDATVNFTEAAPAVIVEEVARLPGVLAAEPFRAAPVRLIAGHRSRRTAVIGKPESGDLSRALDAEGVPIPPPTHGIALSQTLADILHVGAGDRVLMEVLDGRERVFDVPVREIMTGYVALSAMMEIGALNRLLGEDFVVSGAHVVLDRARENDLFRTVGTLPAVATLSLQRAALENFRKTLAENISVMTFVYLSFGGIIAFGVVYNSSRIRLSERARELASLRVLGFTRSEVYWVLFAEFAILVFAAIPMGWIFGYGLAAAIVTGFESELYRMPLVIGTGTYAAAALVVLVAAAVSAVIVRRRINRLDLVSVLKTRE